MRATPRPEAKVTRCTCGAWKYEGRSCMFCKALKARVGVAA